MLQLLSLNLNDCCTTCETFVLPIFAGLNRIEGIARFTASTNAEFAPLRTLNEPLWMRPFSSTTNCASTCPSRPLERIDSGYSTCVPEIAETCSSTWKSMYALSGSIAGAAFPASLSPVPPSLPEAVPPATPLPLKSASLVTFADRSTFGSSTGTFTGALSTWNPFGGAISCFGTGGRGSGVCSVFGRSFFTFGGGGGGSFFLISGGGGGGSFIFTKLTFCSRFALSCSIPARAVAYTAKKMIAEWKTTLKIVPPAAFCLWGFDSSNVVIISGLLR